MVCFQPLKHYHAEIIDTAVRIGDLEFNKIEFLAAFKTMHNQAFKESTILSAFKETRICPFNPEKVISQMHEAIVARQEANRTPTPPRIFTPTSSQMQTPHSISRLVDLHQDIEQSL